MATVLQFGEGNFIRSFIDYLIQLRQNASVSWIEANDLRHCF